MYQCLAGGGESGGDDGGDSGGFGSGGGNWFGGNWDGGSDNPEDALRHGFLLWQVCCLCLLALSQFLLVYTVSAVAQHEAWYL
jgi:hypothetical protein